MNSKHLDYFKYLVVILLLHRNVNLSMCSEEVASISRSLDLSIPAWRPLVQNPYHQYFQQNTAASTPAHLISYSHLDGSTKDEIIEAAKYNAQTLRKYNELSHQQQQQPITSYSNPYPLYTQTPGPLTKVVSTTAFINPNILRQQPLVAASNLIHARLPYPGKSATLYSTKLNFLGKPDMSHHHIALHQNGIHQTIATTPKIAGYTKDHGGRVNFHYHHPSFGMSPIFDSTTKRIPMFGSSVTPHSTTKVHPVMSKLQAHMALAALTQNQHSSNNNNKLKHVHRQNTGSSQEFSPPSQIVSNYANYESATKAPAWHHGFPTISSGHGGGDYHHHVHKPDTQIQQQILPSVHPSIITPFLEQVHLKQMEVAAAAEQKNSFKYSHESSSIENNGSFEVINDVFSKHLVPPPPSTSKTHYSQKPSKTAEKVEKYPKINLSMQSPLQDASRFNYNNVISSQAPSTITTTPSPYKNNHQDATRYRPTNSESIQSSVTEKPNVFVNLNRSKDNPYKHHKLLHPSYTGGIKKKPSLNNDKPFLPTPYRPEKEEEIKIDYEPQHSFFTIEDAVTPHFPDSLKYDHHVGSDELEIITLRPQIKPTKDYSAVTSASPLQIISSTTPFVDPTNAVESPTVVSSPKPRQKLRRRKPKPQNQQAFKEHHQIHDESKHEIVNEKSERIRGNVRNNATASPEIELRTRNRLNHPSRVRTKPNLTSTPTAALTSSDYDYTQRPLDDDNRRSEIATTQTTSEGTSPKSVESSEQTDVVRHRVRLRYKNKLNAKNNSLEGIEFKQKQRDSQISDSENENVVIKQPSIEETTELSSITENPLVEIKSSLKLPNLKLRNEVFTTIPTTAETIISSSSTLFTADNDENSNISQKKVVNRPRFSIKELKRKQFLTSSAAPSATSTLLTSSTSSTTSKPDSQRFNRFRLNLNRRRNETNDSSSSEEIDTTRKRYSSTRFSTSSTPLSSTDSTVQLSTKRTILPKRTFSQRNFTKPTLNNGDEAVTTTATLRPLIVNSSRPSRPSLRQRIQNSKKKDSSNEVMSTDQEDSIKNLNFDTIITHEPLSTVTTTTTTELPITRETSIMKIAKTPSSIVNHSIKATTINSNSVIENTLLSNERHDSTDLVGSPSEHSQRVADLTVSANENSTFKSANIGLLSRRIPNYFTISTDDPILPIQAFFPQIKTNESN